MDLLLKVKHFFYDIGLKCEAEYIKPNCCPVANAARDQLNEDAFEGVDSIDIGEVRYMHKYYQLRDYQSDIMEAVSNRGNPEHIVRTIKLTKDEKRDST